MTDLRVLAGGPGHPVGDAAGLGAEQDRREAGHRAPVEPGQQPLRGHDGLVGADPGHRPGEVQALQRGDVEAGGVDRGPYLAAVGLHREDDEVGQAGPEHRAAFALDDQAARRGADLGARRLGGPAGARRAGQARGQADRSGLGSVGQAGDQLAGHPGGGEGRAGPDGRQERPGYQGAPELLRGHGQLGQAVTLPAVLVRQVQPEHPLLGQAGRERLEVERRSAVRRLRGGADDVRRAMALRPAADGLG